MIRLENLSITYPLPQPSAQSLRTRMAYWLGKAIGLEVAHPRNFVEALRGINLHIAAGEKIGIIGHNGAGKTTLLRAMSGIFPPTAGRVQSEGRITSLIDTTLGMDFEASGLKNIIFKLVYQGRTFAQAKQVLDEIVSLADLGAAIGDPLYTYSSGMVLKLAFVIATYETPEILIMDEIIGAGDEKFRATAEAKVNEIIESSKICIISSHDLSAIRKFCTRAILLSRGEIIADGAVEDVIERYLSLSAEA